MNHQKGSSTITILLIVLAVIVLGGIGYVVMHQGAPEPQLDETAEEAGVGTTTENRPEESPAPKTSIAWRLTSAGEADGVPQTTVAAVVNGTAHEMGTFAGSCSEIGANGGIDGKGLLAGELSAVQCWFAGGGNEIGVFAHEDGGFQIMVGELSEGEEGAGIARGKFDIKVDIKP